MGLTVMMRRGTCSFFLTLRTNELRMYWTAKVKEQDEGREEEEVFP